MDFRHRPDTSPRRLTSRPGRLFGTPARQLGPLLCGVAIVVFGGCSVQAETSPKPAGQTSSNPAHAIAEKFAASASDAAAAKARAEAEATEARRRAAEAKRKSEVAARQAADQRRRDELDILSRARLEAETRDAEARDIEARDREIRDREIRDREARITEAREAEAREAAVRAETARAEAIAAAAETAELEKAEALRKSQQAEREAETLRIVEKLRAARAAKAAEADRLQAELDARNTTATTTVTTTTSTTVPTATAPSIPISEAAPSPEPSPAPLSGLAALPTPTRATVILALANGGRGIDRPGTTTADPVLCIGGTCYVGRGADRPASPMPRSAALGPGNTLGGRAGSCARSLVCVYRDVEIGAAPVALQPVDLRLLRHDRREIASGLIDRTCNMMNGRLVCSFPVRAASWTAWIVPETTATTAGPAALIVAATAKLDSRTAAAN